MNENEFELDGKVYVAKQNPSGELRCGECHFHEGFGGCTIPLDLPPCNSVFRKDKYSVIFKVKI